MIRRMQGRDIEGVLKLCRELHERSQYADLPAHYPTVANTITRAATVPTGAVFVSEGDDGIDGFIVGIADEFWWAEPKRGPRYASDLVFYAKRAGAGRELMAALKEWAASVPRVKRIEVGVASGKKGPAVDRLYINMGFEVMGPMFTMKL